MDIFGCWKYSISELTLPAIASVSIFALDVGLFIKLKRRSTLSPIESIYRVLTPEEWKIIEILKNEGGSTTQKKLSRINWAQQSKGS